MATRHVNASLLTITPTSWTIGDKLLLSHISNTVAPPPNSLATWPDEAEPGSSYHLTSPTSPLPDPTSLSPEVSLPLVYDAGCGIRLDYGHAVWKAGGAFIKVTVSVDPLETREDVTLEAVRGLGLSFAVPEVLFYGEWEGRCYLVVSRVPGETLEKAWPGMREEERAACAARVAGICEELAVLRGERIGGVDGGRLGECWLQWSESRGGYVKGSDGGLDHEALLENCRDVGMECEDLVFQHCDLGPGNVMVDRQNGNAVGIIDWGIAGFAPKDWIRTKFAICSCLDFDEPVAPDERADWRRRVQRKLGEREFRELGDEYMAWRERQRTS